jgi:hypothetical protein
MPINIGRNGGYGNILHDVTLLKQLAADLERIARGESPSEAELSSAPLLQGWRRAASPMPCFVGHCSDHPHLIGPFVITSDTWVVAPDLGWARTLSRFYRLGRPYQPEGLNGADH